MGQEAPASRTVTLKLGVRTHTGDDSNREVCLWRLNNWKGHSVLGEVE